jgi:hypothetical protein
VKPSQNYTTMTWPSTIFKVSSQYELFNIVKYNKRQFDWWRGANVENKKYEQ